MAIPTFSRLTWLCAVTIVGALGGPSCGGPTRTRSTEVAEPKVAWVEGGAPVITDPFPRGAPFVTEGERMSYRAAIHGIHVADYAIVVVGVEVVDGRRLVVVQSGVQASRMVALLKKVNDQFSSWLDAETGRPVRFRAEEIAGKDDGAIETVDARFTADAIAIDVVRPDTGPAQEAQRLTSASTFDMQGFLVMLRSWDPAEGTTATADVLRSRFLWRTQMRVAGYESIITDLGELPAVRIDGVARRLTRAGEVDPRNFTRHYSIWISDDADRVPLRMLAKTDYGDLKMDIIEYTAGTGPRPKR